MTKRPYQKTPVCAPMSQREYLAALDKLGLSQVGAAPVLGLSRRHAQRLATDAAPIPPLVAKVIRLLVRGRLRLGDLA